MSMPDSSLNLQPISRVLVANRGEIAVRVIRACREMGIGTVAVCSEVDRQALHAQLADQVVVIGPAEPGQSYLRQDRILEAARATDADAIHPGYGFLAENAGFARACAEAGVKFIGPAPEVIEQMGEKTAARAIMEKAGVPVVPGALLPEPDAKGNFPADEVKAVAAGVGYPLMVKAAFGGGGKGMRLVTEPEAVVSACQAAWPITSMGSRAPRRSSFFPFALTLKCFGFSSAMPIISKGCEKESCR